MDAAAASHFAAQRTPIVVNDANRFREGGVSIIADRSRRVR
jgi:hypothetical protein